MDPMMIGLGVAAAGGVIAAVVLAGKLKAVRAERDALMARKEAAPPPRAVESRREHFGLLWFPVLTVKDADKLIVAAAAGVPHCAKCVKPLALTAGSPEEWACGSCAERRPASTADLQVTDSVVAAALQEFLARFPGYRAGPGVAARRGPPAA